MDEFNLCQSQASVQRLLRVLDQTSSDEQPRSLRAAIELYAKDLTAVWKYD